MNCSLVREDHVVRYRLFVDTEARVFDAFKVELLQQSEVVTGATFDEAWHEALDAIARMRADYHKAPIRHPSIFEPYAVITACEFARESTKVGLRVNEIVGGAAPDCGHPLHDERVRALCTALDQVEFLQRRPAAVH